MRARCVELLGQGKAIRESNAGRSSRDWVSISNVGRPPGECWALISAVAAAGNSQCRYAIEPRLRCLQLRRERQEGSFLTIAAGKMHADRQAVCRPVQRYAH